MYTLQSHTCVIKVPPRWRSCFAWFLQKIALALLSSSCGEEGGVRSGMTGRSRADRIWPRRWRARVVLLQPPKWDHFDCSTTIASRLSLSLSLSLSVGEAHLGNYFRPPRYAPPRPRCPSTSTLLGSLQPTTTTTVPEYNPFASHATTFHSWFHHFHSEVQKVSGRYTPNKVFLSLACHVLCAASLLQNNRLIWIQISHTHDRPFSSQIKKIICFARRCYLEDVSVQSDF